MEIDGVFSGGGIKGFSLVGAYEVLEERGYRFKRLAGTSAGAIVAGLIAADYTGRELKELICETDLADFLDPRKVLIPFPLVKWLLLYWQMGLYKGDRLEEWLKGALAKKGVYTFADLPEGKLRIVASDLSAGKLLVLPDDLEKYGIPKKNFPVARAIRMSCSIPYFFEPVRLRSMAGTNIVVDGGLLSNFPIWLFHREGERKRRPLIGIKLSGEAETKPKMEIRNGFKLFESLFVTMKEAHDQRHISTRHEKNIIFIPSDEAVFSDFEINEQKKEALMNKGRLHTEKFLKTWSY